MKKTGEKTFQLRLIDTHAHVHFHAFADDSDEVVRRALESGVGMITVGTQKDTSLGAVETARRHPEGVWAAIGLHPVHTRRSFHDAQELGSAARDEGFYSREEVFDEEYYRNLASDPKVVGIGEFGLDYYRIGGDEERDAVIKKQKEVARAQLKLAADIQKPIIFHCRDAHQDLQAIVDEMQFDNGRSPKGIVHSFTGTVEEVREWLERDFMIAFNGIITFARELEPVVRTVPLERIVVETDAPYLTPVPLRGKRNEPMYVEHVARRIAEIKNITLETVAQQTTENACVLFDL